MIVFLNLLELLAFVIRNKSVFDEYPNAKYITRTPLRSRIGLSALAAHTRLRSGRCSYPSF